MDGCSVFFIKVPLRPGSSSALRVVQVRKLQAGAEPGFPARGPHLHLPWKDRMAQQPCLSLHQAFSTLPARERQRGKLRLRGLK